MPETQPSAPGRHRRPLSERRRCRALQTRHPRREALIRAGWREYSRLVAAMMRCYGELVPIASPSGTREVPAEACPRTLGGTQQSALSPHLLEQPAILPVPAGSLEGARGQPPARATRVGIPQTPCLSNRTWSSQASSSFPCESYSCSARSNPPSALVVDAVTAEGPLRAERARWALAKTKFGL
eukprot:scaffold10267_cov116-Isochrysis_galbana.AAC.8